MFHHWKMMFNRLTIAKPGSILVNGTVGSWLNVVGNFGGKKKKKQSSRKNRRVYKLSLFFVGVCFSIFLGVVVHQIHRIIHFCRWNWPWKADSMDMIFITSKSGIHQCQFAECWNDYLMTGLQPNVRVKNCPCHIIVMFHDNCNKKRGLASGKLM